MVAKTSRLLLYLTFGSRYQLLKRPGLGETLKAAHVVTLIILLRMKDGKQRQIGNELIS